VQKHANPFLIRFECLRSRGSYLPAKIMLYAYTHHSCLPGNVGGGWLCEIKAMAAINNLGILQSSKFAKMVKNFKLSNWIDYIVCFFFRKVTYQG